MFGCKEIRKGIKRIGKDKWEKCTTAGSFSWDAVYRTWERRDLYHKRYTKMYFLFSYASAKYGSEKTPNVEEI